MILFPSPLAHERTYSVDDAVCSHIPVMFQPVFRTRSVLIKRNMVTFAKRRSALGKLPEPELTHRFY